MKLNHERTKKTVEVRVSNYTNELLRKYSTKFKIADYIDELIKMYHKDCVNRNIPIYDILPVKLGFDKDSRIRISSHAAGYFQEVGMNVQTMEDIILSVFLTYYNCKDEYMEEVEILKAHSIPMRRLAVDGIQNKGGLNE